jgi:hypothetical protein
MLSLETPVLTIDANTIHQIDIRNVNILLEIILADTDSFLEVENLFRIWTLFSRCSGSIEEGRRLENLSWRLWNRETFCCSSDSSDEANAISISQRSSEGRYTTDTPDLSGSIESNNESTSSSAPLTRRHVRTQDSSCNRGQGKERHITPDDLEKMVITIKEKKGLKPLTMSAQPYLAPLTDKINLPQSSNTATPISSAPEPEKASPASSSPQKSPYSTTTGGAPAALERSPTSVVRGFPPSQISSSHRSITLNSTTKSVPKSALASNTRLTAPKKHAMFALGGSFKDEVATRIVEEMSDGVFDDDVDESAIDDNESSDWEDLEEESGKLSFPRVESRRNLASRRSLITTMLHQNSRAAALQIATSQSTPELQRSGPPSPQGLSDAPSPESDDNAPLTMKSRMRPGQAVRRTGAQTIIMTTTNVTPHQMALSPKTTRRQMLATELTASLRRHLLWERKQKNQTASAVLKRRHTAHDVADLKQYPYKVHLGTEDEGDDGSWDQYFGQGLGEYHSKGW